jgi:hypothetical protein
MKIQIERIVDHGQNSERVELSVTEDCNLGFFIVADTTYTDPTHISNKLRHMYWFVNKEVKCGDKVTLYTRKGMDSSENLPNGRMRYTIYWQLEVNVWNNDGDAAVLLEIGTWKTTKTK